MKLGHNSHCFTEHVGDHVTVGNYSWIADDCRFHALDNHHCIENPNSVYSCAWGEMYSRGPIKIGNDVWIGEGVRILDGVTIGDGAIIGAGAVVASNVPSYAVVVGNPAVIKKYRFNPYQIDQLLKIQWWNWDDNTIGIRKSDFEDIDGFVQKYRI